jgi:hypothetical protein
MPASLTVSDLVDRAGPPHEAVRELWLRRARYWAANGILPAEENVHGGTGRHRHFSEETSFLAAVLFRLSSAGFPISVLTAVSGALRSDLKNPTDNELKWAWRRAKEGKDCFLGIMFSEPEILGRPVILNLIPFETWPKNPAIDSATPLHIVNLGQIFAAMRSRS